MTTKHPLAHVRDTTGKIIHLDLFDEVRDMKATEDEIVLTINTARYKQRRRGEYQITKRGVTMYRWMRDSRTESWVLTDVMPVWWSTDEMFGLYDKERDLEWEQMCYRPGTARNPLDGYIRREAGYKY